MVPPLEITAKWRAQRLQDCNRMDEWAVNWVQCMILIGSQAPDFHKRSEWA